MADARSEAARVVRVDELQVTLGTVFERLGLSDEDAASLAELLMDSELRGRRDHGVAAVGILGDFYDAGELNPRPRVRVLSETDGALLLDGDRGCGPVAPARAMRWCIERAPALGGMAVAAIRDWQLLVCGPYARLAAKAGMIGFACTNFIPLVAPPGGRTRVLGTNPLAYGLPAGRHPPVVLDMATTVTSMQKVRLAAERGDQIPPGVIFDADGVPATDPAAFFAGGSLAPLGSPEAPHKGFGLALLVDALGGVLGGGSFAQGVGRGPAGNLLWALDVEAFAPREEFLARMDAQIDQVIAAERAAGGDEPRVPGHAGERRLRELTARGAVPIEAPSWRILAERCASLSVPLPEVSE
jgi:LDH2 family malate/lactate/ureidoglycolate dehydrogenase